MYVGIPIIYLHLQYIYSFLCIINLLFIINNVHELQTRLSHWATTIIAKLTHNIICTILSTCRGSKLQYSILITIGNGQRRWWSGELCVDVIFWYYNISHLIHKYYILHNRLHIKQRQRLWWVICLYYSNRHIPILWF